MLVWTMQQIILSLLVIVLAHYIYSFFKNNLTTPKIRDMVNVPTLQYEHIYSNNKQSSNETPSENEANSTKTMKKELQTYLTELKNKNDGFSETSLVGSQNFNKFPTNYETV